MKVSFDFDGTLALSTVQEFAKKLLDEDIEVWIVTSRFSGDRLLKKFGASSMSKGNADLYEVADSLGISRKRIVFTNMENKSSFLRGKGFIWHLDDDHIELDFIHKETDTKPLSVWNSQWEQQALELLKM